MAHMNDNDRKRIEFLVSSGFTAQHIADDLGRRKSTILRELINRSVESNRNYKCSNRICALFDRCPRIKGYGRDAKRSFKCTPRCFDVCPDFIGRKCERLRVPSHVCNGCKSFTTCPMMKRVYPAQGAQANYDGTLHDSRRGVLDGRTAYGTFIERFGEEGKEFLDKLGIVKIPANEVTLDPILLGAKFKRHADRVILRKAGVTPTKSTEDQK